VVEIGVGGATAFVATGQIEVPDQLLARG